MRVSSPPVETLSPCHGLVLPHPMATSPHQHGFYKNPINFNISKCYQFFSATKYYIIGILIHKKSYLVFGEGMTLLRSNKIQQEKFF